MRRSSPIVVATSLCSLMTCVSSAVAQSLPAEGKLAVTYSALIVAPVKPIAISKTQDMIVSSAILTAVNDAGSGFLHNLAGRCLMSVVIDKVVKTLDQHGYCTYTDADGDQLFAKVDIDKQPLGAVILGKGQWVGGTGKYAGLEGAIEIHHSPLKSPTDGVVQASGKKIGTYKINKPM